jgi:hypothetical protein
MLAGHLSLWDVADVEAMARSAVAEWTKQRQIPPDDHEDLLAHLIVTAWERSGLDGNGRPLHPASPACEIDKRTATPPDPG